MLQVTLRVLDRLLGQHKRASACSWGIVAEENEGKEREFLLPKQVGFSLPLLKDLRVSFHLLWCQRVCAGSPVLLALVKGKQIHKHILNAPPDAINEQSQKEPVHVLRPVVTYSEDRN